MGTPTRHPRPGTCNQTINNQIVVLPDGTLVLYRTIFEGGDITQSRLAARAGGSV